MFKKIILSIFIIALLIINGFAYTSSTNLSFKLMEDTDDSYTYTSCINDNFNLVDDLFDNVSTTEFGYLDGVTSAIQTQFGLRYLKTEIDSLSEVETIYGENITSSTELATYCETTQAYYNAIGDLPTAAVTNGDTTHISTADAVYDFCETTQNYALNSELHSAVTIGTANGLSLSTQALSLQLATTDQHGALSDTDWDTFNNKAASGANSDITSMTGITTPLAANYGGTGVANAAGETITLTGGFALDMTLTAATGVTLPISGTLYGTKEDSITSAQLLSSVTNETGTGALVFGTSPTFTTSIDVNGTIEGGTNITGVSNGQMKLTNNTNSETLTLYGESHPGFALCRFGTDSYGMRIDNASTSADYYSLMIVSGSDAKIGTGGTFIFIVKANGNVAIGDNLTPTARLHIAAGTATASTAPLKFTSGTLLNTAEAGAIEFLTDKYYATITTAAERKTLAYVEKVINTLGDTDVTPDVSAGEIFISQSNGAATAITDLDSPQVGKTVTIICGHATNPPSIADGGNFKMAGNWTSDIDDSITFFVKADNYYIEIARSAN